MSNQDTACMHEELKEGDSLYVSKTAIQGIQEQEDKYWEVDYSFMTYSDASEDNLIEFTDCCIGVMAKDKYELLRKLGAFMEHQAGVRDGQINITIASDYNGSCINGSCVIEHLKYNQQTKAFTPIVLN